MKIRTPTAPEAALAAALAVGASAVTVTWIAVSARRFVQINTMRGHILDSRTGCVWIMTLRPPTKVCPGDVSKIAAAESRAAGPITARPEDMGSRLADRPPTLPPPDMFGQKAHAPGEVAHAPQTPDEFMRTQVSATPHSFDPIVKRQASSGWFTLSDIVTEPLPFMPDLPEVPKPAGWMTPGVSPGRAALAGDVTGIFVGVAAFWLAIKVKKRRRDVALGSLGRIFLHRRK